MVMMLQTFKSFFSAWGNFFYKYRTTMDQKFILGRVINLVWSSLCPVNSLTVLSFIIAVYLENALECRANFGCNTSKATAPDSWQGWAASFTAWISLCPKSVTCFWPSSCKKSVYAFDYKEKTKHRCKMIIYISLKLLMYLPMNDFWYPEPIQSY